MSPAPDELRCPHCNSRLRAFAVPDDTQWVEKHQFVCFNDDCSYFQEGWEWMEEQYSQHASYRYMVFPTTGTSSMIPVWSDSATREMIVEDDDGEDK